MVGNFHRIPKAVLATWPTPNYVDPHTRDWMPAIAGVLLAFSTVMVWARFYLRARRKAGPFGLDDLFICVGWLASIGLAAVAIIGADKYGLDRHTWDVPPNEYVGAARGGWIAQIIFLISTVATKTSVLLFYRRMVKNTYSSKWLYAIYFGFFANAAYFFGILFTYCKICSPLNAYWLSYKFDYSEKFVCINGNVLSLCVGILSILTDIYAVAIPWAMLASYDLNIPRREKIGLNLVFGLGLIAVGTGIARTYYLWRINHDYDTSWIGFTLYVWSLLECNLVIIAACAPALRAFLRQWSATRKSTGYAAYESSNHDRSMIASSLHNASTVRGSGMLSDVEKAETRAALYGRTPPNGTSPRRSPPNERVMSTERSLPNLRSPSEVEKEVGWDGSTTRNSAPSDDMFKPLPPTPAYNATSNARKYSRHGYGSYGGSAPLSPNGTSQAQDWI